LTNIRAAAVDGYLGHSVALIPEPIDGARGVC